MNKLVGWAMPRITLPTRTTCPAIVASPSELVACEWSGTKLGCFNFFGSNVNEQRHCQVGTNGTKEQASKHPSRTQETNMMGTWSTTPCLAASSTATTSANLKLKVTGTSVPLHVLHFGGAYKETPPSDCSFFVTFAGNAKY